MAYVPLDELLQKIPSKFNLVMVAAKRARQLKDGAPRLIPTHSVNPVTIALEEIGAGKIILEGMSARVIDDFGGALMPRPGQSSSDFLALRGKAGREGTGHDVASDMERDFADELGRLLAGAQDADADDLLGEDLLAGDLLDKGDESDESSD